MLSIVAWIAGLAIASSQLMAPKRADLLEARAYWLDEETIVWDAAEPEGSYRLHFDPHGKLRATADGIAGGEFLSLAFDPAGPGPALRARFPHLARLPVLKVAGEDRPLIKRVLKGQVAVAATDSDGKLRAATGIQIAGVLDALYAYAGPLGVSFDDRGRPTLRVWAPTAQSVALHLFEDAVPGTRAQSLPMDLDDESGVWRLVGEANWTGRFYLYEVTVFAPGTGRMKTNLVTDPYSLSLAADSSRSQIVDLDAPELKPPGWSSLPKPPLDAPEDIVIYELHVRDFSINDPGTPAPARGTYTAFSQADSLGVRHLRRLADAGVTHVHLLPVFDIATVPEQRADQLSVDPTRLAGLPPDSTEQQAAIAAISSRDGFNWGYDPWHYTVPEGSYATEPDGVTRIREFRVMVAALSRLGLRVVMDVVYNHTHAAGQAPKSVLDRIVPGYYHRLQADGSVASSTCCPNTATEHAMMEKLMIDSVLTWATAYKVDGFRFDLMGHHSKSNMLRLRAALDALTPESHGVDGRSIYLYGEGWNFGEVADDARFEQARQANMGGTGIGTFSDRLRDGVRGGVHGSDPRDQGFSNGLGTDPSEHHASAEQAVQRLLSITDWIRVGLAADIADFAFVDAAGERVTADRIDYGGNPAGYTQDPAENIGYVAAHDNETLFDANQMKLPPAVSMEDRVKVQTLASALVLLGQGVPFIHAGQEFLRSKSLDRDSFDSGDWFNAIDWTLETGNWGKGLPIANRNREYWPLLRPLLANPALAPGGRHRQRSLEQFLALLRIRAGSALFRLRTAEQIRQAVRFHNTGPDQVAGLIVMSISDPATVDPDVDHIVVMFNARPRPVAFGIPTFEGVQFDPHVAMADLYPAEPPGKPDVSGTFRAPGRGVAVYLAKTR